MIERHSPLMYVRQISSQLEGSVESTIPKKPPSSCVLGQPPVLNGTHWFLNETAVVVPFVLVVVTDVDGLVVAGVVSSGGTAVSAVTVTSFGSILQHKPPQQVWLSGQQ